MEEQYLLRQQVPRNMVLPRSVQQNTLSAPVMSPSYYEKVRLAHGLPWEKLVRKKLSTLDMSETNRLHEPVSQSSPKALLKALREKEDQLVSFRFFDGHYLEFYFFEWLLVYRFNV